MSCPDNLNQKIFAEVKAALLASELGFEVVGGGFKIVGRSIYIAFPHKSFGDVYPQIYYDSGAGWVLLDCSSVEELISKVLE